MPRSTVDYEIREFQGLNTETNKWLLSASQFSAAENICIDSGKIKCPPVPVADDYSFDIFSGPPLNLFIKKVYVDSDIASQLGGTNFAYLVVSRYAQAYYVNPYDLTKRVIVKPIVQSSTTWGAVSEIQQHCLITGWKHLTFNNPGDNLLIKKGSDENHFVYSTDNGSSWSPDRTVSTTGTLINVTYGTESTNLIVYFLSDSISDWTTEEVEWKIVDTSDPIFSDFVSYAHNRQISYTYIDNSLVFSWCNLIMYTNGNGIASVGYKPIHGTCVRNYYNHLFVGQFSENEPVNSLHFSYDTTRNFRLAWSDLNNIHEFFPQIANEADTYLMDAEMPLYNEFVGITGLAKFNDKLYVFTNQTVYEITYVGLPLVMQIVNLERRSSCGIPNSIAETKFGVATINNQGDVIIFDGANEQRITSAISFPVENVETRDRFFDSSYQSPLPGFKDIYYNEVNSELNVIAFENVTSEVSNDIKTYTGDFIRYWFDLDEQAWNVQLLLENAEIVVGKNDSVANNLWQFPLSNIEPQLDNPYEYIILYGSSFATNIYRLKNDGVYDSNGVFNTAFFTFNINDLKQSIDYVEIKSVLLDIDVTTKNNVDCTVSVSIKGYDNTAKENYLASDEKEETIASSDELKQAIRFDNFLVYGNYFEVTVELSCTTALRNFTVNNIVLQHLYQQANVEK